MSTAELKRIHLCNQLKREGYSIALQAFVSLQFKFGLRVSDALNISYSDISRNGTIVINQGKGSEKLIARDDEYLSFWNNCQENKTHPFRQYSRFYIYRLYKKFGISTTEKGRKHDSVTHAPRKMLAQELQSDGFGKSEIKTALGHKSERSTEYYLDKRKRTASYRSRETELPSSELHPIVIQSNGIIRLSNKQSERRKNK